MKLLQRWQKRNDDTLKFEITFLPTPILWHHIYVTENSDVKGLLSVILNKQTKNSYNNESSKIYF